MNSVTAGGKTRTLSHHIIDNPHLGITKEEVAYVLDNWTLRGIFTDQDNRQSRVYYAFVPALKKVVRVAVSMDDTMVNTAFADSQATKQFARGNWGYFSSKLQEMETRDVTESSL